MKRALLFFLIAACIYGCAEKLASFEDEPPTNIDAGENLIYFWVFDGGVANNTELEHLNANFPENTNAHIEFVSSLSGYPNTNRKGSMERRNRPTDINYRPEGNGGLSFAESNMRAIQVRQPFEGPNGENTMIFHLPSTGFKDLALSFAAMDEDAASALQFDYSVSSGQPTWTTTGLNPGSITQSLTTGDFRLFTLNLANVTDANNNPNLKVRIRFVVPDGDADNGDRVTFNNVALDGNPIE